MLPTLRPHQSADLEALRSETRAGRNPVLVAPCGYGKGTLISVIVHNATLKGHHVIFAVHGKSLVVDMSERVRKLGIEHGVLMGGEPRARWHSVQVASIDTLHRMAHPPQASLVIIDECFVKGTLVTMGNGFECPIEMVEVGDLVRTATGQGRVKAISRKQTSASEQVVVKLSNGKRIECTTGHPFFSESGWIRADLLEGHTIFSEEALRSLREGINPSRKNVSEKVDRSALLWEVLCEESRESDVEAWRSVENGHYAEANWTQTEKSRREREHHRTATGVSVDPRPILEGRACHSDEGYADVGISNLLQTRLGGAQFDDRHRAGWAHSYRKREIAGLQEGHVFGDVRVESVSSVEPSRYASVYNLHISRHPSYFANGVLVHNCHMALSPTWRKTLDRYPNARVIGATATPIRLDGKGLGKATGGLFDSMVLGPSEDELISLGHLVGSRVLAPPPPSDLGTVKKTAGEFNQKELATVCDKTKLIGDIVTHWKRYASDKKTAAFGVDQAHAHHIMEQFRDAGVQWAYVDAETKQDERAQIWKDLDYGSLMGVSSVGCISVGWDHSVVSCLISARPTVSMGLWRQMLGRGSRPHPGKDHFLVLDHAGNTHRHAPYGIFEASPEWSLDGAAIKEAGKKPPAVATCKHSYRFPDFRNDPPKIINGLQLPCYATFRAGPENCPMCGIPLRVIGRKVEVVNGELQEIARPGTQEERLRAAQAAKEQKSEYYKLLGLARKKGFKDGWAYHAFCKKFGFAPPMEWLNSARDFRVRRH
jgi:superfamily II DNA or RNA helicase